MVLLDGFSKIPFCSTEGRALMSMDVASYRSGTSPRFIAERLRDTGTSAKSCPVPTAARPYRTMAYVDTYIKLFYFPSNVSALQTAGIKSGRSLFFVQILCFVLISICRMLSSGLEVTTNNTTSITLSPLSSMTEMLES